MDQLQAVPGDKAVKFDAGKLPYHLVPWDAMDEVTAVLRFGAKKYGERNWERGGHWSRDIAACFRHITRWFIGEDLDPESGRNHLAHAICCLFFALAYNLRKVGVDDRPKTDMTPFCCIARANLEAGHSQLCNKKEAA